MQFIEVFVERQAPRPPSHVRPEAHSSHALQRGMQRTASDSGHERVQVQVGLDEGLRLTRQDRPMALLEQQVEVKLLSVRAFVRRCPSSDFGGDRRSQLVELGPVRSPVRDSQHARGRHSASYEDADPMSHFDHPEVRQRRQSFPQDGQADP